MLHPSGELSFVELVLLMNLAVARVLALGLAGGHRDAATEGPSNSVIRALSPGNPPLASKFFLQILSEA